MRSDPPTSVRAVRISIGAALAMLLGGALVAAGLGSRRSEEPRPRVPPPLAPPAAPRVEPPAVRPSRRAAEPIRWRRSIAVGAPAAGRLVRGVRLPAERPSFFTWDPVLRRSPNRRWRRWGTDRLVRMLLEVAREYRRAHPRAPRLAIGDLSRPRGGDFGRRFGPIGHASHQNGLDVDVYYPRTDRREVAPTSPRQIDRALAQDLVNRFVRAGAQYVFVGKGARLRGPRKLVDLWPNHDDHMHVRIRP
jgi:murein endopeptidase